MNISEVLYISASDYNKKKSMNCKWIGCTNDQFF